MQESVNYQGYSLSMIKQFQQWDLKVWDRINLELKSGQKIADAIVLPRYEHSEEGIISIKLKSGYNTGIKITYVTKVEKIGESKGNYKIPENLPDINTNLPKIVILGLGGTIASRLDYRTGGVIPAITPNELFALSPELASLGNVSTRLLFEKFSEDLSLSYWLKAAKEIALEFNKGARGVVVGHGTDTLSYGSAVLSFALKNLPGPVVITAAQRSSDRPSSDSYQNLMDATFTAAQAHFAEVVICAHSSSGDDYSYLHRGTWVRKMHSSRRDTFQSIPGPPIGRVNHRTKTLELSSQVSLAAPHHSEGEKGKRKGNNDGRTSIDEKFEEKIGLIYTYPGMGPELIDFYVEKGYRGLIIAGTGLGHVPKQLLPVLKSSIKDHGLTVVMTTQTLHGYVGMHVYERGRELLAMGVLSGENLLPETAYVKLSYVLGHFDQNDGSNIKRTFEQNLVGELTPTESYDLFPVSKFC